VEGRGENAGGAEADEEAEEEARGEEVGPAPACGANAGTAGTTSAAACHDRNVSGGGARVPGVCGAASSLEVAGVGAVRETARCHDAESHCSCGE
jgi:hypothetical protein